MMHDWFIEDREYDRHEQRRGRRHAYEALHPARTALVVVDMVPFFVQGNPYCRGIVPNIRDVADATRAAGGLVAWVVPGASSPSTYADEFYGPVVARAYRRCGGEGPPRQRVWPEFELSGRDLVVEKTAPSAFFPGFSPLPALLEERGITTVLITGTVTNVCCESSARDASTLGYRVIVLADATAAGSDREHNATLHTVYRSFGDVRTTADVIDLVGQRRPAVSRP